MPVNKKCTCSEEDQLHSIWNDYFHNRSSKSKEALIEHYISLVKVIASRLFSTYGAHVEFDELVSYGVFGLIDAIEKYDPGLGVKFEAYAQIRIRGSIVDEIRNQDWVPRSLRRKAKEVEDVTQRLEQVYPDLVPLQLVADELNISLDELHVLQREINSFYITSLEERLDNSSDEVWFAQPQQDTPEKVLLKNDMIQQLAKGISSLKENHQKVITLYYYEELTYREISAVLGISESRISQIHSASMKKLKSFVA